MRTAPSWTRWGSISSVDKPVDGFSEQENYSLAPEAFHLPPIAFTDTERAALQTALTLLDGEFAYAEPLRLALQQITWGRPSPLGSDSRQTIGLGITASAGGAELSARLAKIDTAIYRRKRIEFEYHTMQRDEIDAAARSTRITCCSRAASSTSSATRTSATTCACSGSRASRARSPTPPRPSTTSSARRTSTRACTRTASPGSSARLAGRRRSPSPRTSPGTSSASTAPTARSSRADDGERIYRTELRDPAPAHLLGARLPRAHHRAARARRGGRAPGRPAHRGPPRRAAGARAARAGSPRRPPPRPTAAGAAPTRPSGRSASPAWSRSRPC